MPSADSNTSDGLRVVVCPFGSEGDVNPLLWAASAMAAKGHFPKVLLPPQFGPLADKRGLPWLPVGRADDFESMARDPEFWHPNRGPARVGAAMLDSFPAYLEAFEAAWPQPDLVICSTLGLAAAFSAESRNIPCLHVHLQPVILRSLYETALVAHGMEWLPKAPRFLKRAIFGIVDAVIHRVMKSPINQLRSQLGLSPLKHVYREAVLGGTGVALLTPPWFAAPQPDWPENLGLFDFPLEPPTEPPPREFLEFVNAHGRPFLWTHGSANYDTARFHSLAASVSEELAQPFVIAGPELPGFPLPASGRAFRYLPFDTVFPHCSAVIHHGGIGTTSKALAAGIPQLVVPRAHDQPDNAARVQRLGAGLAIPYPALTPTRLKKSLQRLLHDPSFQDAAAHCGKRIYNPENASNFADYALRIAQMNTFLDR